MDLNDSLECLPRMLRDVVRVLAEVPACPWCGEAHDVSSCARRCRLCGDFCFENDASPPVHRECFEAEAANQDIPEGEAAREQWREGR